MADRSRLVEVAIQAGFVDLRGRKLCRIPDIRGGNRFGVLRSWPVTGLAGSPLPLEPRVRINRSMRSFVERIVDILVASLAGLRANVSGWEWR